LEGTRAEELKRLGAATVGESGGRPLGPNIRAAWSGAVLCAPAFTARCMSGDNLAIHAAVAYAPAGSVIVVSVGHVETYGYWGEVLTTGAQARGLCGLVIEGGVRDVAALEARGFPVFSTMIALRGASKVAGGEIGLPVEVGGVSVRTGDVVLADADGVVIVESENIDEVLSAARARAEKERGLFESLTRGRTTLDLLGLDTSSVEGVSAWQ
jgi:4-hydroxy-4-methyl-2-oxoglutarate aldolase